MCGLQFTHTYAERKRERERERESIPSIGLCDLCCRRCPIMKQKHRDECVKKTVSANDNDSDSAKK